MKSSTTLFVVHLQLQSIFYRGSRNFFLSLNLRTLLENNINAKLHRMMDVKITITSIQNQKQMIREDSYPNTCPKRIAIKNKNIPIQNMTKIINLKYSTV